MCSSNTFRVMLALMAVSLIVSLIPQLAWAAGDDSWVQPGTSLMENLESGLVTLGAVVVGIGVIGGGLRSEATTSELKSLMRSSYAVCCLKKNKPRKNQTHNTE